MVNKKVKNPKGMIAVGICFMGAGVAISSSANNSAGYGLVALGFIFMIVGFSNKKKDAEK